MPYLLWKCSLFFEKRDCTLQLKFLLSGTIKKQIYLPSFTTSPTLTPLPPPSCFTIFLPVILFDCLALKKKKKTISLILFCFSFNFCFLIFVVQISLTSFRTCIEAAANCLLVAGVICLLPSFLPSFLPPFLSFFTYVTLFTWSCGYRCALDCLLLSVLRTEP